MVKTIGVVGAGTMGNGIAQVAAEAGYQVILQDIDEKYVQVGLDAIKKISTVRSLKEKWKRKRLRRYYREFMAQ